MIGQISSKLDAALPSTSVEDGHRIAAAIVVDILRPLEDELSQEALLALKTGIEFHEGHLDEASWLREWQALLVRQNSYAQNEQHLTRRALLEALVLASMERTSTLSYDWFWDVLCVLDRLDYDEAHLDSILRARIPSYL